MDKTRRRCQTLLSHVLHVSFSENSPKNDTKKKSFKFQFLIMHFFNLYLFFQFNE